MRLVEFLKFAFNTLLLGIKKRIPDERNPFLSIKMSFKLKTDEFVQPLASV